MILPSWMAWTQDDATAVQAAIRDLAIGARKVKVSYAGPPAREVDYAPVDLPQLRSLLAEILRAVNGAPRFRHAAVSKGFDIRNNDGSDDGNV